jgi:WD40 repeat protein
MEDDHKHNAFLSYRRRDGRSAAHWLRNRLLRFRLPEELRGGPVAELDIYLDVIYERATRDFFGDVILPNLHGSDHLIVIVSPRTFAQAADVDWMRMEVDAFCDGRPDARIIAVVTFGDIGMMLPFDIGLRFPRIEIIDLRKRGVLLQVLWPPYRWKLNDEVLKVAAALHRVSDAEMPVLRREEQRRRQRRLWAAALTATLLSLLLAGLSAWAILNLIEARRTLAANYVEQGKRLFDSAPGEARLYFAKAIETTEARWLPHVIDDWIPRVWLGFWAGSAPPLALAVDFPESVSFSADGRMLAVASRDRLLVAETERGTVVMSGSTAGPQANRATLSGSGSSLISYSRVFPTVDVFDVHRNRKLRQIPFASGPVQTAAFRSDESVVVFGGSNLLHVLTPSGDALKLTLEHFPNETLENVQDPWSGFDSSGRFLGVLHESGLLQVWNTEDGKLAAEIRGVSMSLWKPNASELVVARRSGRLESWAAKGHRLYEQSHWREPVGSVQSLLLSGDGQLALIVTTDLKATAWSISGRRLSTFVPCTQEITALTLSRDGKIGAFACGGRTAQLWSPEEGIRIGKSFDHTEIVTAIALRNDGLQLATGSADGAVRLWPLAGMRAAQMTKLLQYRFIETAFSSDRSYGVALKQPPLAFIEPPPVEAVIFNTRTGKAAVIKANTGFVVAGFEGQIPWTLNKAGEINIWTLDGRLARTSALRCNAVAWSLSPQSTQLLCDASTSLNLASPVTGRAVGFPSGVFGNDFIAANDCLSMALFRRRGFLDIWKLPPTIKRSVPITTGIDDAWVTASGAAWIRSTDNSRISIVTTDNPTPRSLSLSAAERLVDVCAESPDQLALATVDINNVVRIRKVADGQAVGRLMRHAVHVSGCAFAFGGRILVTAAQRSVFLWNSPTGEAVGDTIEFPTTINAAKVEEPGTLFVSTDQGLYKSTLTPVQISGAEIVGNAESETLFHLDPDTGAVRLIVPTTPSTPGQALEHPHRMTNGKVH